MTHKSEKNEKVKNPLPRFFCIRLGYSQPESWVSGLNTEKVDTKTVLKNPPFFKPDFLYKYCKIYKIAPVGAIFNRPYLGSREKFFNSIKSSWSPITRATTYIHIKNLTPNPPPLPVPLNMLNEYMKNKNILAHGCDNRILKIKKN